MKRVINIILASALLVGSTTSCSDFLQKDPPSSPSQSIFWQKKSDFDSALAGSFSMMYEWPGVMSQIVACFDNLTDNSICQHMFLICMIIVTEALPVFIWSWRIWKLTRVRICRKQTRVLLWRNAKR